MKIGFECDPTRNKRKGVGIDREPKRAQFYRPNHKKLKKVARRAEEDSEIQCCEGDFAVCRHTNLEA